MEFENKQYEPHTLLEAMEASPIFGDDSECPIDFGGRICIPLSEFKDDVEALFSARLEDFELSYWKDVMLDYELFIGHVGALESYKYADLVIKSIEVQVVGFDYKYLYLNVALEDQLISTSNVPAHLQ